MADPHRVPSIVAAVARIEAAQSMHSALTAMIELQRDESLPLEEFNLALVALRQALQRLHELNATQVERSWSALQPGPGLVESASTAESPSATVVNGS